MSGLLLVRAICEWCESTRPKGLTKASYLCSHSHSAPSPPFHRLTHPRFPFFFSLSLSCFIHFHSIHFTDQPIDRSTAMNQIDQSLDDIIKKQREQKKKMKGKSTQAKDLKIPKKQAGGVKSRAAIRTDRSIRAAKPNSPYAVS